jgi:general stress protein CsbA
MEPGLVKQFAIGADGLKSIKNGYLIRAFILLPFIVIPTLFSDTWTYAINSVRQPQFDANLGGAAIMTVIFFTTVFIGRRQLSFLYREYTIRLNDQFIEKCVYKNPKVVLINVHDISRITRMYNGSIYIYFSKSSTLFIPQQIENRAELEAALIALDVPFFVGPYNFFARYVNLILTIAVGLVVADFFTSNKWFVSIDSAVLLSSILLMFIMGRKRSKKNNLPKPTAMPYLVSAGIVVLILLFRLLR